MEGALGERLKREFGLDISGNVGMASLVYNAEGRNALRSLWLQYLSIANEYGLPFLATTPTRRANHKRVLHSGYSISIIKDNVKFLQSVLKEIDHPSYLGGLMGCRGNAYTGEGNLSEDDAFKFHRWPVSLRRPGQTSSLRELCQHCRKLQAWLVQWPTLDCHTLSASQ